MRQMIARETYEVIEMYGVTLRLLTHDKIELLRFWRNHPKIQQTMAYRAEITPEMQESWFERINTSGKDFYYIVEYEGRDVGCINIKDVDFEEGVGEPGIFFWDDDVIGTDVPTRASFCLGHLAWNILGLKKEVIHVLKDNKRAIRYNKLIGFKLSPSQSDDNMLEMVLTREDAAVHRAKLKKYLLDKED